METTSTHDSDSSTNSNASIALPYSSNSNSYEDDEDNDKDMIILHAKSVSYTSLKDLLNESQTSGMSLSGTNNNCHSSCYELPIKNHLVKQAALAYLTPMSLPRPAGGSRFCCGCFGWIEAFLFGHDDDVGCD